MNDPRHHAYVEKKHREGKNAWNPLGGSLTPSKHEQDGSTLQYGEHRTGHKFTSKDYRPKKEKTSAIPSLGGIMSGAKAMAGKAVPAARAAVGKGALRTMQAGAGTRAAVGAGMGAATGAVGGALTGGGVDPATGQPRSRLGAMAGGALGGAALGAGAGLGARKAIGAAGASKGALGKGVRNLMQEGGETARDARSLKGMQTLAGERRAGLGAAAQRQAAPKAAPAAAPAGAPAPSVPTPNVQAAAAKGDQARQTIQQQGGFMGKVRRAFGGVKSPELMQAEKVVQGSVHDRFSTALEKLSSAGRLVYLAQR